MVWTSEAAPSTGWQAEHQPSNSWSQEALPTNSSTGTSLINYFIAVGDTATVIVSTDGITWLTKSLGLPVTSNLYSVAFGHSLVVAVGAAGTIVTSPDLNTWTYQTSGVATTLRSVAWSGTMFCAVGDAVGGAGAIRTSLDGVTWTTQTSGTAANLICVTWDSTMFVAVGDTGAILTSTDGVTWTARTSGSSANLKGVASSNDIFVVVGAGGTIVKSSNGGSSWSAVTSGTASDLRGVARGNSIFAAVGIKGVESDAAILTSDSGDSWTARVSGVTPDLNAINNDSNGVLAVNGVSGTSAAPHVTITTSSTSGGNTSTSHAYSSQTLTVTFNVTSTTDWTMTCTIPPYPGQPSPQTASIPGSAGSHSVAVPVPAWNPAVNKCGDCVPISLSMVPPAGGSGTLIGACIPIISATYGATLATTTHKWVCGYYPAECVSGECYYINDFTLSVYCDGSSILGGLGINSICRGTSCSTLAALQPGRPPCPYIDGMFISFTDNRSQAMKDGGCCP